MSKKQAVENYVRATSKSQFVSFLLTFLFGPLGVMYASVSAGLMTTLTVMALAVASGGVLAFVAWPVTIITAASGRFSRT